ncbi:hypothetical protein ACQCVP_01450 [Rossellomorea vietnamensis]|uniref:hypothetical protein n=1 Tax=Rossellomorea vietnamensis TaxID=218284 RepID=UPI003CEF3839
MEESATQETDRPSAESPEYDDKEIAAVIQTFLLKAVFVYIVAFRKIPRAGFSPDTKNSKRKEQLFSFRGYQISLHNRVIFQN